MLAVSRAVLKRGRDLQLLFSWAEKNRGQRWPIKELCLLEYVREATEVKADWEESAAWSQILQVCDRRQFQLGEPCHAAAHWVSQQDCIDKSSR